MSLVYVMCHRIRNSKITVVGNMNTVLECFHDVSVRTGGSHFLFIYNLLNDDFRKVAMEDFRERILLPYRDSRFVPSGFEASV
jgi:hypothetical protein